MVHANLVINYIRRIYIVLYIVLAYMAVVYSFTRYGILTVLLGV